MKLKLACLMSLLTIGIVETMMVQPAKAHSANQTLTQFEKNQELNQLLREGKKLVDQGKLSEALSRYQHAKTLDPKNPRIFSAIGYLQAKQGNFSKAIPAWKQAVALAPDNSEFHYALAYSLANNENYAEAASAYQKTVELDEDNVKAYFALSLMQIQQKNYEQALQTINQLLQVSPNYTSAKRLKGIILLKQKRFSEAKPVLLEVSQSTPNDATIQLALGITWLNLEQVSNAIDAFKKAAHLEPDRSGKIHLQIGRILETEGDIEKALEAYEEAVESKPNLVEARKAIADIFLEQKETLMAIVNHRQVLELDPDNANSYYHLGLALRDRGRIKEAIANLKQALTLYQQQNQLEAVETIKSILQNLTPSNPL